MPTYEYQCDACQHNFDEFQGINDKPLKKCPKCGKTKLRRVFGTGAAILFKGSGFYQTDYRSESYKAGAKAESDSAKPPAEAGKTPAAATDGAAGTTSTDSKKAETKSTGKSKKSST
ncbi:MAG: FmdB family zinc ribbon protein [Gemmataceae bacterium]